MEQEAPQLLGPVEEAEEYLDYLNKEISKYISHVIVYENNEKDSAQISAFFRVSGNLERIGDHAMNICEYTKRIAEKGISFHLQPKLKSRKCVRPAWLPWTCSETCREFL